MALAYEIDADLELLLLVGAGSFLDEELEDVSRRMLMDPGLARCSRSLADFRQIALNELTASAMRGVAKLWQPNPQPAGAWKLAMVTSRKVDFGTTRMYQAFTDESMVESAAFLDVEEAERWLGLPRGHVDRRVAALLDSETA